MPSRAAVVVTDAYDNCLRLVTLPGGVVTTIAGSSALGFADGAGVTARFNQPSGVLVLPSGAIIVADQNNQRVRRVDLVAAIPACDSTWHHVALAYAPSASPSLSAFLDGALAFSQAATITLPARAASTLRVGWSGDLATNSGSLFSGALAELRVYSRALSATEVAALSQPLLASYLAAFPNSAATPSTPTPGATAYAFSCTTSGSFGLATLARSALDGRWGWAGGVTPSCAACPAGTYSSASGGAACTPCPSGITTTGSATGSASIAACTACAPGYFGSVTSPGTVSAAGCAACAAGTFSSSINAASCAACPASTYSFGGRPACASCATGATLVSASAGCTPSATLAAGPADTAFYLSGTSTEGVGAIAAVQAPAGITYQAGPFGATGGALALAAGSYLSVGGSNAPSALPAAGSVAWTASAWVKCAAPAAPYAAVLEWGAAGDVASTAAPQAAALVVSSLSPQPPDTIVSTLAGSRTGAYADGTGTSASFSSPYGVAVNPSTGVVVVADRDSSLIRLVTPLGVVTTLAGSGAGDGCAFTDATGTAAAFCYPSGVAVIPSNGVIVVADSGNSPRLRLVSPQGVVTSLAGSGTSAFADGTGTSASFSFFFGVGIAVLPSGSVIVVTDTQNNAIRAITYPAGDVTTLAGGSLTGAYADGTGAAARFYLPQGLAATAAGNVIVVADTGNHLLRLVTYPAGVVTTLAGSGNGAFADGVGAAASLWWPTAVAWVDAAHFAFIDAGNSAIRLVTYPYPTGLVITLAGRSGSPGSADGTGAAARFGAGQGLSSSAAGVVVADTSNWRIRICAFSMPLISLPSCDQSWHHVALTYAPAAPFPLSAFLDGALVLTSAATITLPARASSTLRIGWSGNLIASGGSLFAGALAELRVYSRALSSTEVAALSQPPLASYLAAFPNSAATPATPTPGATSYLFSCTTSGSFGSATLARNALDGVWGWAGGVTPSYTACPAGAYSSASGGAACTPCPAGITTTGLIAGSSSVAACTTCAPAFYGSVTGSGTAGAAGCAACPAGISTGGAAGSSAVSACTSCAPGYAGAAVTSPGTLSAAGCAPCAAGTYAAAAGAASCAPCPAGTYSFSASSSCTSCSSAGSLVSGAVGCQPAAALLTAGPADTAFYLTGSAAAGTAGLAATAAAGLSSVAGPLSGSGSGALALAAGSYLTALGPGAPAAMPGGGSVAWSASAWVKCAAPSTYAAVLEWGAAGDSTQFAQTLALVVDGNPPPPNSGTVTTLATGLNQVTSVDYIASAGVFVAADLGNNRVVQITAAGGKCPRKTHVPRRPTYPIPILDVHSNPHILNLTPSQWCRPSRRG